MRVFASGAVVIAGLLLTAGPAGAVDTLRGSGAGNIERHATVSTEGGIQVIRGAGSPPRRAVEPPTPIPVQVVGGRNVWFIDVESDRLIGCQIRNTGHVGRRAIRCAERTLSGTR